MKVKTTYISENGKEFQLEQLCLDYEAQLRKNSDFRIRLEERLTKEIVDLICPEHNRSHCNDDSTSNGFYTSAQGDMPLCTRCALLEVIRDRYIPAGITFRTNFETE